MFTSDIQLDTFVGGVEASCPGWFILRPAQDLGQTVHSKSTIICFASNIQFDCGASCPGWFTLPPTQDLGQAVSSVNSYCTIILEYVVVRNIDIISVKLRCLHPTFSLVTFVGGVGASCPGWFILRPAQDLGLAVSSVNSYCIIILEYVVVRDIEIIAVKLRCLHPPFSLVTLVGGVWGKLSRLVYRSPRP